MNLWKEVPGFTGIFAHPMGAIGRLRDGVIQQCVPFTNSNGYPTVKCNNKALPVHRAVALTFVPNPESASDVNHIDGVKTNNTVENLEWCSRGDNIRHALRTGLHANPEKPVIGVNETTGDGIWAKSQSALKKLGFQQALVSKCVQGERPRHRGYRWEYA